MARIGLVILLALCLSCESDGLPDPGGNGIGNQTIDDFTNIPILERMVVYEVNLRAFSSAGTLNGVNAGLDHIESLGVNVIWLMPIYPIGIERGVNSPYSISDYENVSSEYGTLNDLINLVNEAHKRGIAVILDWVANHTAWDHGWIRENPDWYTKDGQGNIISPEGTGWADVADLNYKKVNMQNAMIEAMKHWIVEAGIDGFRCDAVDFVPSSFWTKAISEVNSVTDKDLIWLAEGGESSNFTSGFAFNYSWDFHAKLMSVFSDNHDASGLFTTHLNEYRSVPTGKFKLRYITNHDIYAWDEPPFQAYGDGQVGAFVATAFMPGIPLIYNGQEVGVSDHISFFDNDPVDWSQNPDVLSQYQAIMSIRSGLASVTRGELISYSDDDIITFKRALGEEEVLVLVNTRATGSSTSLPKDELNKSWIDLMTNVTVSLQGQLTLDAFEFLILRKQ